MKPILFNTEMVRAILERRKTVTRRVVKPQPPNAHMVMDYDEKENSFDFLCYAASDGCCIDFAYTAKAPYRPGDILYVRETWANISDWTNVDPEVGLFDGYIYKADWEDGTEHPQWRPSIHMPREAARIFLRVTDVRVERLQDITEERALLEGARKEYQHYHDNVITAREVYRGIWESTIKPKDRALYGWEANPWVWVIGFERISKVDMLKEGAVE